LFNNWNFSRDIKKGEEILVNYGYKKSPNGETDWYLEQQEEVAKELKEKEEIVKIKKEKEEQENVNKEKEETEKMNNKEKSNEGTKSIP